jgi:small-conductance mechanosensitive channel
MTSAANSQQPQEAQEQFFTAAYERIVGLMFLLLAGLVILFWVSLTLGFALGFLAGGVIAILNFISLKKLVIAFADRVIASKGTLRSSGLVLRFVLRYGLVAVAAYAIFKSSAMSAYGLLAGLGLPVPAIMIEAGYELYGSLRRGY